LASIITACALGSEVKASWAIGTPYDHELRTSHRRGQRLLARKLRADAKLRFVSSCSA
jgi:hypothetical protein